jgi:hypothetical protein
MDSEEEKYVNNVKVQEISQDNYKNVQSVKAQGK